MSKKIKVYSTPNCAACNAAKQYLESIGVEYESYNVGEDANARNEMMEKNGGLLTVPTIDVEGQIIVGFDRNKLEQALK